MPRYCAVKVCTNRGGTASKRGENKRISFYPFPLQDKARLQRWVDNMKREEWTPSRHQYVCSEHFTEECFDVRWGIRYLKNTAVPTVFPYKQDAEAEKRVPASRRSAKAKTRTCDMDTEPTGSESPLSKTRTSNAAESTTVTYDLVPEDSETVDPVPPGLFQLPPASSNSASLHEVFLSEIQTAAACELPGRMLTSCLTPSRLTPSRLTPSRLTPSRGDELLSQGDVDPTVTVLCCESLGPFCDSEAAGADAAALQAALGQTGADAAALQAALGQAFAFLPVELIHGESVDCVSEDVGPGDGEHVCVYEHSYCRADTDREQLWSKILSLHAKILELDSREEDTVAKIRVLENQILHLKRDGAVFKEKQKALEDYLSSILL